MSQVTIIGTGPAGLMAATVAARAGHEVALFEKRKGPGHKLLVAGSSGLNVTHEAAPEEFARAYRDCGARFKEVLARFGPADWLRFIEELGIGTFKGTSRRYFVDGLKASGLLRAWLEKLGSLGATVAYGKELVDFELPPAGARSLDGARGLKVPSVRLKFADGETRDTTAVVFALGGASWEPRETPLRWPALFLRKNIAFKPFHASNVGFKVSWPPGLIKEAEGKPLKNISLTTSKGTKRGDLVLTRYGLEGTPVYFVGHTGQAWLDLKPDLEEAAVFERLSRGERKLSPLKKIKKQLALGPASFALVAHLASPAQKESGADLRALSHWLKTLPVTLDDPQPLEEAISSAGGVAWDELDSSLMLRKHPGVFCAGEMIDWDAPTGGFLIQGAVSQGHLAGTGAVAYCASIIT